MRTQQEIISKLTGHKIYKFQEAPDGFSMIFEKNEEPFMVIASWGGNWEHVSVSIPALIVKRLPTWDEMCAIKELFFKDEECVIQYHPAKKDYINNHPFVLHLWKPTKERIPMPPKEFV